MAQPDMRPGPGTWNSSKVRRIPAADRAWARTTLADAATLGLLDRVEDYFAATAPRHATRSVAPSGVPATAAASKWWSTCCF
jgi:hypothetical protein